MNQEYIMEFERQNSFWIAVKAISIEIFWLCKWCGGIGSTLVSSCMNLAVLIVNVVFIGIYIQYDLCVGLEEAEEKAARKGRPWTCQSCVPRAPSWMPTYACISLWSQWMEFLRTSCVPPAWYRSDIFLCFSFILILIFEHRRIRT